MKKFVEYLKYFLCGMLVGAANVIPGVSGGTMLVVFGIFDKLTDAISGIKKIFKNVPFLATFALGVGAGILLSAKLIVNLLDAFPVQMQMSLIGLILGGIPLIYRIGTSEEKVKPFCIVPFVIAMAVVIGVTVLDDMNIINITIDTVDGFDLMFSIKLMVCAIIAAITMIIPGISGDFIMMLFGMYKTVVDAIDTFNFYILVPFAIGAAIGVIIGAKFISFLIRKNKLIVYSVLMGMVIGSVYAILPEGFGFNLETGYGFALLLVGMLVASLIDKIDAKKDES